MHIYTYIYTYTHRVFTWNRHQSTVLAWIRHQSLTTSWQFQAETSILQCLQWVWRVSWEPLFLILCSNFHIFQSSYPAEVRRDFFLRFSLPKVSWNLAWNFGELFRATFSRVWVCEGKFHQNVMSKTVWETENFMQISLCWGAALTYSRILSSPFWP